LNKKAKRVTLAKLLCLVMAVMTVGALLLGALTRASYWHDVADAAKSPDTKILYHSKVILSGDKEGNLPGLAFPSGYHRPRRGSRAGRVSIPGASGSASDQRGA